MTENFNLLELHDEADIHPRSWICFKGKKLSKIITVLEANALNKSKISREALCRKWAQDFGCSHSVIKRTFQKKTYIPIPIILKLVENTKQKREMIRRINAATEYLKINGGSAKPTKACKKLSPALAKIVGAFMADGSLQKTVIFCAKNEKSLKKLENNLKNQQFKYIKKYAKSRSEFYVYINLNQSNYKILKRIMKEFSIHLGIQTHTNLELLDRYEDNVRSFNSWVYGQFRVRPSNFYKNGEAWRTYFCNKIISRYLMKFFDVIPGPKSSSAFEPKIINKSNMNMRKEFAKGVLMFDGCVDLLGIMSIQLNSISLIESLKDILTKDKIKFVSAQNKHVIRTTIENKINKISFYFEKGTHKYNRLRMIKGEIKIAKEFDSQSDLSLNVLFKTIKKAKCCDVAFLMKKFGVGRATIMPYLRILQKQEMIKLEPKLIYAGTNNLNKKTCIEIKKPLRKKIFGKLKFKFKEHQKAAKYLGTNKQTYSSWKLGKNRIPLPIIKKISKVTGVSIKDVANNTRSTDRLICSPS